MLRIDKGYQHVLRCIHILFFFFLFYFYTHLHDLPYSTLCVYNDEIHKSTATIFIAIFSI